MLSAEVGEKPLKENPNGLFMIDVADLCEVEEGTPAAAFVPSSVAFTAPPGLNLCVPSCHAVTPRDHGRPEDLVRRGHRVPPHPLLHDVCPDQGDQSGGASPRPRGDTNSPPHPRSQEPEAKDTGLDQIITPQFTGPTNRSSGPPSIIGDIGSDVWGVMEE